MALERLLKALIADDYTVVGPTVRDEAIVYDEIVSLQDLPEGWTDDQEAGQYRLARRGDEALFGYAVGPHSWKKYLFPPSLKLWSATRGERGSFAADHGTDLPPKYAFIGVRACELAAIRIQDQVFMGSAHGDPDYAARRKGVFIIALNCSVAGGTCFCVSMETGPAAKSGYDIALTELLDAGPHRFVAEAGSQTGQGFLDQLELPEAPATDVDAAAQVLKRTAASMGRSMNSQGIRDLLYGAYEHRRWEDVASRCLSCTNCTMVCPTCFCHTVVEAGSLNGEHASRTREWDSCFSKDFSYMAGGTVRDTIKSRYRQWMTHKLATWLDQFGTSGCVGCGRCITWCPVGIDITEEVAAIRDNPISGGHSGGNTGGSSRTCTPDRPDDDRSNRRGPSQATE